MAEGQRRGGRRPRTLLEQLIWQREATYEEQVEAFGDLAQQLKEPATLTVRHLQRLASGERSGERAAPSTRRVMRQLYGHPLEELLGAPQPVPPATQPPSGWHSESALLTGISWAQSDLDRLATLANNADVLGQMTNLTLAELEWQVSMAARRALRFAASADGSNVGAETLDQLASEVRRVATEYQLSPVHTILGDLVNLQDVSFRLLEGRQRPHETRDLYVLAGMVAGMMANVSHDLGDNHAAIMQARTAYVCADNADHDGLRAWVRGIQSMISYWAGWTHDAVKFAALGAEPASRVRGTVSAWIPALQARAWAVLGNAEEVRAAIQRARSARECVELSDLDMIGGKLTFPLARQLYYAADANSWLAGEERSTSDFATSAIFTYGDMPANEGSYVDEAIARTDLALARARGSELDGVQDAISPVLDLTPSERIGGVIVNAVRVAAALRDDRYRGARLASQLIEELEDFTQMTAAAILGR